MSNKHAVGRDSLPAHQSQILGHPTGLFILFFTELWERFSYYGMRALFVLFLTAAVTADNPGFGWTQQEALALYGWYTMLVYVSSIPGGIIADKWLGQKRTVMLGGALLCLGHVILAIEGLWAFYAGISFIVLGVGCLKPNISTMVGGLYKQGDERRDKGFYIFYIGINIGAFLAGIIIGTLGEQVNWHYGFGLAGIGMLIGQAVYVWGQKYLTGVGEPPIKVPKTADSGPSLFGKLLKSKLPLMVSMIILAGGIYLVTSGTIGYGLMIIAFSLFVGLFMVAYRELLPVEKDRVLVLLLSFFIIIAFWGAFEQAGGLMSLYTKDKTDRLLMGFEIPASWFQSLNPFFIMTLGTVIAGYWYGRKLKGKEASSLFKMATGLVIMGWGFGFMVLASNEFEANGSSAMYWLVLAYLFHTIGELCASPVSLSFITKLAPARYASIMMGIYWAATGIGNKIAGALGELAQGHEGETNEFTIFLSILAFCTVFGLLILSLFSNLSNA